MEKRRHDEKSLSEMFARCGVLFDGANEERGRTDDAVFSVRGVRESVERELKPTNHVVVVVEEDVSPRVFVFLMLVRRAFLVTCVL